MPRGAMKDKPKKSAFLASDVIDPNSDHHEGDTMLIDTDGGQLLKEKHDNTLLIAETLQQKSSWANPTEFAVGEFEALQYTFNLERDLRTEAEKFAREMLVEQKQLKRQSLILTQSPSPSQALQEALSQVTKLTRDLNLEHENQIQQMEDRLKSCEMQKELRRKLELLEEERMDHHEKYSKAEVEVKDLRFTASQVIPEETAIGYQPTSSFSASTSPTTTSSPSPSPLSLQPSQLLIVTDLEEKRCQY
ncbi:shootin-1 isoform X3 [Xyrichtys novacula]|uniref:Shootin-1 n=1 Tax=Xyrichtys novacula TaxID=13765 RepID=A0AAV1F9I8_XYRNO|nr:shootin-1 isoform X3 [Xyrichtys novacula]